MMTKQRSEKPQKQKETFYSVIAQTILSSETKAMCVSEIYKSLEQNYGDALNVGHFS